MPRHRMICPPDCSFFFFQAEDGIRDVAVTGVQTCALPICFSLRRLWIDATMIFAPVSFRSAFRMPMLVPGVTYCRSFAAVCSISVSRCSRYRSEERRVGKECRCRWAADHLEEKGIKRGGGG